MRPDARSGAPLSERYLWDGSGEPDPEVERLERLLAPLRHDRPAPSFPQAPRRRAWASGLSALAAAAGLVAALGGVGSRPPASWEVMQVAGTPRIGGAPLLGAGRLRVGQWLKTDAASRALLVEGEVGQVEIEPGTSVGLLDAGPGRHRLSMSRGVLRAMIWAPPRQFVVETPSATAVDMGCAYTLAVDAKGLGQLDVEHGWVAFEWRGRESFVPGGARCLTRPGIGPGTPFYPDASEPFREALAELDAGGGGARPGPLQAVLDEARARDALTLWHLLARVPEAERLAVFDRLAELLPPPEGVTREGIGRGDGRMRDAWWERLDLGTASWWRLWKQPAPPEPR